MIYDAESSGATKKVSINSAHCAGGIVVAAILILAGLRYFFVE
jgi:hypothetical protein